MFGTSKEFRIGLTAVLEHHFYIMRTVAIGSKQRERRARKRKAQFKILL
jgi:hypothetical protein